MSDLSNIAVRVQGLHKTFRLPHEKRTSVKSVFVNLFRKQTYEKQHVLNGVEFEIQQGEFFGIVGRNGSGKSTLLKVLAGIYQPSKGKVDVTGSLVPFIELGVGFNPELTGRENVYLNGALLGFGRKEMDGMYDDIVEFAELEKFMDQKLKNYSSGMQVRLAFSIAIRARGDILLLDEVLAVGDSAFQQKCYDYFASLKQEKRTIILVSHNMQAVEQFCDRALLLESGKVKKIGESAEIGAMYEEMFMREEATREKQNDDKAVSFEDRIKLEHIQVKQHGKVTKELAQGDTYEIKLQFSSEVDVAKIDVGINIKTHDKTMILSSATNRIHGPIRIKKSTKTDVTFMFENILNTGVYTVNIGIADISTESTRLLLKKEGATTFMVGGKPSGKGLALPDVSVSVTQAEKK